MGTMMKVSAAVLVAAACVYFVARTQRAESPRIAGVEPLAADVELADAELVSAAEDPTTEAVRRSPVAEESPVGVSAARGTNVLRVVLEGITEENARMTRVTLTGVDERNEWPAKIRDSWPCQGLTSEFDLDPFFAVVAERHENLRVDELGVQVDHPLHLIERTRVPLSRGVELKSGQTVYEVRVRLVPGAVIHGRLAREDGDPASDGLVGALLLERDFPIEADGRAVECAADGAFELRVPASGRYALASYEEGRRPTTTRVEALVGARVDVGTIVLESGHAITGYALRRGKPLAGASVSATPPTWRTASAPDAVNNGMHASVYEGRNFATPDRSVHFLWLPPNFSTYETELQPGSRQNGRFELAGQRVSSDENGAFAFVGLGSGEYLLRMRQLAEAPDSVPGYWGESEGEEMYEIHGDRPALVVHAPGHGVVFKFHWTAIRFELAGDLESEDEGRLVLRTRSAGGGTPVDENGIDLRLVADPGARNLNFTPAYLTTEFPLYGDKPTYALQVPPNMQVTGEVAFPGRQPVPLEFWTPEPGGELVVPIQLVRAEELTTLVIELENPQTEIPETFSVMLWRSRLDDAPPDTHLVEVADGQLRVEGIFPGKYRVRVRAGGDRNYSAGLFHENEFDLELPPGLVVTQSIMMWQGAGLRVTLRDEDGALLSGEYEFYDHLGASKDLNLYVLEDNRRWGSSWKIYPYGTHESSNELHPGRYRLVLLSQGYAKRSVMLELRAGEYEDVDVTLSK